MFKYLIIYPTFTADITTRSVASVINDSIAWFNGCIARYNQVHVMLCKLELVDHTYQGKHSEEDRLFAKHLPCWFVFVSVIIVCCENGKD